MSPYNWVHAWKANQEEGAEFHQISNAAKERTGAIPTEKEALQVLEHHYFQERTQNAEMYIFHVPKQLLYFKMAIDYVGSTTVYVHKNIKIPS